MDYVECGLRSVDCGVWKKLSVEKCYSGCRDGEVVRALASHQCGPG